MAFLRDKSVFCIPERTLSFTERYIIGGICIATSTVGFVGATLQLNTLWQYRDRQRRKPSANPRIIFYLALADLVACLGIFGLAIGLMSFEPPTRNGFDHYTPVHDALYASVGTTMEVFTLFAYLASYIWTFAYALDMCFQIYGIDCPMIVYHILAWLIPLDIVASIEILNYVKYPYYCEKYDGRTSRLILSYLPVMVIIVANPVLFLVTYRKVRLLLRTSGTFTVVDRNALNKCKQKFFWMVFVFTLCWFPNVISVSYDIAVLPKDPKDKSKLDNLWFFEAFVNPLQGIFNYFVYRHSFRVTATDTRRVQNFLPRVPRHSSNRQYVRDRLQERLPATKVTVQSGLGDSLVKSDEETPLLSSSRSSVTNSYIYKSRLLGE